MEEASKAFNYERLKPKSSPDDSGDDFIYNRVSVAFPDTGSKENDFQYNRQKLQAETIFQGWFATPWFYDWFGGEEIFEFEHHRLKKSPLVEGSEEEFRFENLKSVASPVISNDDFEYKRP
jgi:hypothetical protein